MAMYLTIAYGQVIGRALVK